MLSVSFTLLNKPRTQFAVDTCMEPSVHHTKYWLRALVCGMTFGCRRFQGEGPRRWRRAGREAGPSRSPARSAGRAAPRGRGCRRYLARGVSEGLGKRRVARSTENRLGWILRGRHGPSPVSLSDTTKRDPSFCFPCRKMLRIFLSTKQSTQTCLACFSRRRRETSIISRLRELPCTTPWESSSQNGSTRACYSSIRRYCTRSAPWLSSLRCL